MTPAIKAAQAAGVTVKAHPYRHDPNASSYGLEAAQALGLDPARVFKTLLVMQDGDPRRLAFFAGMQGRHHPPRMVAQLRSDARMTIAKPA